jgi:hypothetical protein
MTERTAKVDLFFWLHGLAMLIVLAGMAFLIAALCGCD